MAISTRFMLPVVAVALLLGVGCSSTDSHVFNSTTLRPVTVSVVDSTTQQTVWSKAVPAGQTLVLDLDRTGSADNPFMTSGVPADRLSWKTYPLGSKPVHGHSLDSGTATLPGTPVKLDVAYTRPTFAEPTQPTVIEQPTADDTPQGGEAEQVEQPAAAAAADADADAAMTDSADDDTTDPAPATDEPMTPQPAADPAPGADGAEDAPDTGAAEGETADDPAPADEPIMFK